MKPASSWRFLLVGAAMLACVGPQGAPAEADLSRERLEIVDVVEQLFSGMQQRDTALLSRLLDPNARLVSVRATGGDSRITSSTAAEFLDRIAMAGDTLTERMWDPEVRIAGDIATLWAPYDFYIGTEFSHCGHDAFHLVRQNGAWLITAVTYSARTSSCGSAPPR